MKLTNLNNGVGVYLDVDRTQLVKWHMSLRDSQYGYLGDLGEILGEMHSVGDSIVREALSPLGTHLSLTTNNIPYIPHDSLFILQLATDSTNTM